MQVMFIFLVYEAALWKFHVLGRILQTDAEVCALAISHACGGGRASLFMHDDGIAFGAMAGGRGVSGCSSRRGSGRRGSGRRGSRRRSSSGWGSSGRGRRPSFQQCCGSSGCGSSGCRSSGCGSSGLGSSGRAIRTCRRRERIVYSQDANRAILVLRSGAYWSASNFASCGHASDAVEEITIAACVLGAPLHIKASLRVAVEVPMVQTE